MDLAAVMDQVKGRLTSQIADLNGFAYPPGTLTPEAVVVTYPDTIELGLSYGGGLARIPELPVVLVVGKVSEVDARNAVAAYASGSGPRTVQRILESGTYTALWTIKVLRCEITTYVEAGNTYLAATFPCDITGPGG